MSCWVYCVVDGYYIIHLHLCYIIQVVHRYIVRLISTKVLLCDCDNLVYIGHNGFGIFVDPLNLNIIIVDNIIIVIILYNNY